MTHDQDRPLLAAALQPRDHVGAVRLEEEELRRDAGLVQHLLHVFRGRLLTARRLDRRVGGVHLHERLEVAQRFGLRRFPVGLRLPGRRGRGHDGNEDEE